MRVCVCAPECVRSLLCAYFVYGGDAHVYGGDAHVYGGDAHVYGGDAHVYGDDAHVYGGDVQVPIAGYSMVGHSGWGEDT